MQRNPFAPPSTEVADVSPVDSSGLPYFSVSLPKLAVLSVCSLGIYEIYWFYRQWRCVRQREQSNISPFWRGVFAVLFCYSLLRRIRETDVDAGLRNALPAGPLATGWILLTVAWKLPDPYWLLTYFAVVFLLPVQSHINHMNEAAAPGHNANARFSAWNWVATVLGGLFVALGILGTFFPHRPHGV